MHTGAYDDRRKEMTPKRRSPVAFLSGHKVNSLMTVIVI